MSHWHELPSADIPVLPTLAQFSNAACQVIHNSIKHQFLFSIFKLYLPSFHTVQAHLNHFSILLPQLIPLGLDVPEYICYTHGG